MQSASRSLDYMLAVDGHAYIGVPISNGTVLSDIARGTTDLDRHIAMLQLTRHAMLLVCRLSEGAAAAAPQSHKERSTQHTHCAFAFHHGFADSCGCAPLYAASDVVAHSLAYTPPPPSPLAHL
eukprot:COSAG02_NODE_4398_length_5406_cov_9.442623_3_plen_124_part_00